MKVFVVEVVEEDGIDMMEAVTNALDGKQITAIVFDYEKYLKIE